MIHNDGLIATKELIEARYRDVAAEHRKADTDGYRLYCEGKLVALADIKGFIEGLIRI